MPYDRLVTEILSADGTDPTKRGAAKFYLDRLADPNLLTRDVGRMFLGRDLQCAQCHDHPLIDDYKQAHYYGIFAFLNRTTLFDVAAAGAAQTPARARRLAEKADGDVTFSSVFKKKVTHKTGPRILDGPAVTEPSVPKGAVYLVAPDKEKKVADDPPLQPPRRTGQAAHRRIGPRFQSQHRQPPLGALDGPRARAPRSTCTIPTTRPPTPSCSSCSAANSWRCTTT